MGNLVQFVLVACFSQVAIFLGKLMITISGGATLYLWLHYDPFFSEHTCDTTLMGCNSDIQRVYGGTVSNKLFPMIVVVFLSYGTASAFLSVYELAIQTILLCFCEDYNVHNIDVPADTQLHREAFMSQNLRRILLPASEYQHMKKPMTREEVMALGKPRDATTSEALLSESDIVYYANQILRGSEEALQRQIKLHKMSDKEVVMRAGGPRLIDAWERHDPSITHSQLVDIVYEHADQTKSMQASLAPMTQEQMHHIFDNQVSDGLAARVKSAQHGRLEGQKIKRKLTRNAGSGSAFLKKPRETDTDTPN